MRRIAKLACVVLALAMMVQFGVAFGQKKAMTQGEFAMWLVREVGAEGMLPPAATVLDYFDFLKRNGLEPCDGWEEDEEITVEDLECMLGLEPDSGYTFEELVEKLKELLAEVVRGGADIPTVSPAIP